MKPVEVFKAEDFRNSEGYLLTSDKCAEAANKLLSERLVKYYGRQEGAAWLVGTNYVDKNGILPADTHIIYGLEPQPIPKEPVKREITREDLARALDKLGWGNMGFSELCKELGL